MWIKFVGMVLIVTACSGLGFRLAWLYNCRLRQCRQVEQCLQRLLGEIRFHQLPLAEALRETGEAMENGDRSGFSAFLIRLAGRLDVGGFDADDFQRHGAAPADNSLARLWQQELDGFLSDSLLGEERQWLQRLGRELGSLDLEAQVRTLQQCLDQWKREMEELQRQEETHGRLYRGLGISAGCFLAILLL